MCACDDWKLGYPGPSGFGFGKPLQFTTRNQIQNQRGINISDMPYIDIYCRIKASLVYQLRNIFLQCLSYIFQCHMAKVINSARLPILCRLLRRLKRRTSIGLKNHAMWGLHSIANMVCNYNMCGVYGSYIYSSMRYDEIDSSKSTSNYGPHHDMKR